MGATNSSTKRYLNDFQSNPYSTPPKANQSGHHHHRLVQLQCDPRSPTGRPILSSVSTVDHGSSSIDGISRTPIQIDSQTAPVPSVKMYNHVLPEIVGPDIVIDEIHDENELRHRPSRPDLIDHDLKRSSGIEPTLDPSKVLKALENNCHGQLPPYQL